MGHQDSEGHHHEVRDLKGTQGFLRTVLKAKVRPKTRCKRIQQNAVGLFQTSALKQHRPLMSVIGIHFQSVLGCFISKFSFFCSHLWMVTACRLHGLTNPRKTVVDRKNCSKFEFLFNESFFFFRLFYFHSIIMHNSHI